MEQHVLVYTRKKDSNDKLLTECLSEQKTNVEEVEQEYTSFKDKPLHCMYHLQVKEVAEINKSYWWLERTGLENR